MKQLKKVVFMKILEVFKEKNCKTIEDIENLINQELKNDEDIVFSWKGI